MPNDAKEIARAVSVTLRQSGEKYADDPEQYVEYCFDAIKGLSAATICPMLAIVNLLGHDNPLEICRQIEHDGLTAVLERLEELAQ